MMDGRPHGECLAWHLRAALPTETCVPERKIFWAELTTKDFEALDPDKTIAVLPLAATEQHGPHLPVMTDTAIAEGMIALLAKRAPPELGILVLPLQPVGKSNEHLISPGTLTFSAETLLRMLLEIGASVRRAGLRKLVLANSHGGNASVIATAARELRVQHGMLVVATHWQWFGCPEGLYDVTEARHGIHGGDIETSLMLDFRPELVRMDKAANFVSAAVAIEQEFKQLSADGTRAFGWIAQDLHPDGAVGNATLATADKGARTAEHQVAGFIELLHDVSRFDLSRLHAELPRK
jgi:creatinine amidohydrolase